MAALEDITPLTRTVLDQVEAAVRDGVPIDEIDETIISSAPVGREKQAAIWLYAWALQPRRRQLDEARRFLVSCGD